MPEERTQGAESETTCAAAPRAHRRTALAWLTLVLACASAVVTILSAETRGHLSLSDALFIAAALGFSGIGALTASRRPRNSLAWVFAGIGLSSAAHAAGRSYAEYGLSLRPEEPAGVAIAAWVSIWTFLAAAALLLVFLPLRFPDGGLPSRRWRPASAAAEVFALVGIIGSALRPGALPDEDLPFTNPFGVEVLRTPLELVLGVSLAGLVALVPLAAASLAMRYRRGTGTQRQQIRWLLYPVGLLAGSVLADDVVLNGLAGVDDTWMTTAVESVAIVALPVATGIAVLRHRLLDIDVVIERSLVFTGLTAAIGVAYAVLVSSMTALLPDERGLALFVATGVVAVLFAPLRSRTERAVSRFVYGQRRDPYGAVTTLGQHMQAAADPAALPVLVESLAQSLRLSYAAIDVDADGNDGEGLRAEVGIEQGEAMEVPLRYHGREIGRLRVAAHGPGDSFSAADRHLIHDIARLAAVTAHSIRLADDLQRSRRRLVAAREEERSRLRRDLHDSLGPTLAGIALQLTGVGADTAPAAVEERVARLRAEIQAAVAEVRRLVDGLRPPALDELGLAGAIERHAAIFGGGADDGSSAGLRVAVRGGDNLPPLPPAVEVAAYRIATEALTNVVRHAQASTCTVRISADGQLCIEVADDGGGIPEIRTPGVGLRSMQERAVEVGGNLVVESSSGGGTCIRARLPLE